MIYEKKSHSSNIFVSIILFIISVFLYIILKTEGFGYLTYLFNAILKPYLDIIEKVLVLLIVIALTYLFLKLTNKLIRKHLEERGRSSKNVHLFLQVYNYFIWFIVIFITLSLLFKQIGSLITSLGLIGFGLTIALQKPILNFVGWITIIFGKAYQIGDIISINTTTGKVYDIKAMYTNLAELTSEGDPSGKSISIPNEFVLTTPIINYTKGTPYVWDSIQFFITYQSDWKKAFSLFEKTAQNFYDKNIKKEVRKAFKENFDYAKIIARVNINEKGIILKARYLVDFNNANTLKTELVQELLSKLRIKGITLGKIEDIKSEYKTF